MSRGQPAYPIISRENDEARTPTGLTRRPLRLLFACLFVVMVGYGITFTVLPYYAEEIHGLRGESARAIAFHVGVLTSVYALAQLVAGPFVGRLSDRIGRRPVFLVGLAGMAVSQGLFGLTRSLPVLYLLRVLGGLATSGVLVTSSAYVADATSERDRAQGMAWVGTTVSLGLVAGPVLGGVLSRPGITIGSGGWRIDGYSLPFLFAGLLALAALALALRILPESRPVHRATDRRTSRRLPSGLPGLGVLLALVAGAQFGLALFEGTFVLYARDRLALGPGRASVVFLVCGVVMAVLQVAAVGRLSRVVSPLVQVATGLTLMGAGIVSLVATRHFSIVLVMVGVLALGTALVIPNLSALVSRRSGPRTGAALGLKDSASSLGQFVGPFVGGVLLGWRSNSPFLLGGALLLVAGLAVGFGYRGSAAGVGSEQPEQPLLPDS